MHPHPEPDSRNVFNVVNVGDQEFVWDGVNEPEEYGAQSGLWDWADPNYSATTTTTTVPPTTAAPTTAPAAPPPPIVTPPATTTTTTTLTPAPPPVTDPAAP